MSNDEFQFSLIAVLERIACALEKTSITNDVKHVLKARTLDDRQRTQNKGSWNWLRQRAEKILIKRLYEATDCMGIKHRGIKPTVRTMLTILVKEIVPDPILMEDAPPTEEEANRLMNAIEHMNFARVNWEEVSSPKFLEIIRMIYPKRDET